ncbi:MAG TPA: DUF349 domain-containing protein [Mycobacteriales bacterium]|nr:DUF349 domain-containing protein [Mycobacteriales bacterium]
METQWGRVAEDGTVYVRTADGERAVGSWHAGDAEAGLAHFARRYDDLATEVDLLAARLDSGAGNPGQTQASLTRLRESLDTAAVVGDIEGLRARIDAAIGRAKAKQAEAQLARAAASSAVLDQRRALADEAERVAQSSEWKASGDRLRAIVEEWKALPAGPKSAKPAETEQWQRIAGARRAFDKRREAHFAALETQREQSRERKEALIREAERLTDSTEWTATANRYKELMASWKSAGRAARGVDDELWARFKAAQDAFFGRRAEHFAARDAESASAVAAREALLAEAESLEPERDLAGARNRLAAIVEKWEKAGRVPRDAEARLDARLAAVERRVRDAGESRRDAERRPSENPFVVRLRESLEQLDKRAARARAAGDEKAAAAAEAEAATKRQWLAQAEATGR